ncbi:hypothetical protein FOZ63_003761, partial [Perkinsus olseni]
TLDRHEKRADSSDSRGSRWDLLYFDAERRTVERSLQLAVGQDSGSKERPPSSRQSIPGRRSREWDESSVYGRLYGDAMKRLHARIEGSSTAPPDSSHDAGRRSFTEHMADSIMRL